MVYLAMEAEALAALQAELAAAFPASAEAMRFAFVPHPSTPATQKAREKCAEYRVGARQCRAPAALMNPVSETRFALSFQTSTHGFGGGRHLTVARCAMARLRFDVRGWADDDTAPEGTRPFVPQPPHRTRRPNIPKLRKVMVHFSFGA